MSEAFIVDTIRLPRAKAHPVKGAYAALKPVDLLKPLYDALLERNSFSSADVDQVLLGCSSQVFDQGTNIAKISALNAGWADSVSGITLSSFCCSGLDAINLGASKLMAGIDSVVVAGGIEQLSRVHMFADKGAWHCDPEVMRNTRFMHMGLAADLIACIGGFSREQLDSLALQSHQRARAATKAGYFSRSLIGVKGTHGKPLLEADDAIRDGLDLATLAALPASFTEQLPVGQLQVDRVYAPLQLQAIHSAGNAPALVDGASLVLMANAETCARKGWTPRAKVQFFANASDEPVQMLTGHLRATEKLLQRTGLAAADIDLWEVNESFAASVLLYQRHFSIDSDKLNVNGGAIAMGHPLGASGGNLIGMLVDEMERRDLKRGVASICGGAGLGVATLITRE
jgi:acetyl-CoA C-acetyltransferase